MRLVTWNCKGGFGRKHASIAALAGDVLVLPECGRLDAVENVLGASPIRSFEWVGENQQKGLGVVSYGDYSLTLHPDPDPALRWILPLRVDGPVCFALLAVWTIPDPTDGVYSRSLFHALDRYDTLIRGGPVVIAGDFNQSVLFDKPRGKVNFADWVARAESIGLQSTYHVHRRCDHGNEPEKTFYQYHHEDKGHHIDFIFASRDLLGGGVDVEVGVHTDWRAQSDHMPLACSFGSAGR